MVRKQSGLKPKHIPQRLCIACRQAEGKRALIRLVRTEEGIEIDPTGKKAGRGAYLHPNQSCWQAVLQGNRLGQALRTTLSNVDRQKLVAYMATLPVQEESLQDKPVQDKVA